jgi:hypothetical protein
MQCKVLDVIICLRNGKLKCLKSFGAAGGTRAALFSPLEPEPHQNEFIFRFFAT